MRAAGTTEERFHDVKKELFDVEHISEEKREKMALLRLKIAPN